MSSSERYVDRFFKLWRKPCSNVTRSNYRRITIDNNYCRHCAVIVRVHNVTVARSWLRQRTRSAVVAPSHEHKNGIEGFQILVSAYLHRARMCAWIAAILHWKAPKKKSDMCGNMRETRIREIRVTYIFHKSGSRKSEEEWQINISADIRYGLMENVSAKIRFWKASKFIYMGSDLVKHPLIKQYEAANNKDTFINITTWRISTNLGKAFP